MVDSPDVSDSGGESGDDSQLTIRIPNPKVYMARQSQWKGRRGKPRCDHCRLNNLKCDRVLPTCNHCAWANGRECKYTPLPTPAHRGIPRCDRCRQKNLKCDRNLPVCNHCGDTNEIDCNYTPKKRHKVPSDHHGTIRDRPVAPYAAKTASFLVSDMPSSYVDTLTAAATGMIVRPSHRHVFESEMRTEPQIRQYVPPHSHSPGDFIDEGPMLEPEMLKQQSSPDGGFTWIQKSVLPPILPQGLPSGPNAAFHRPFLLDQGMIVTTPHIDPWMHPSFASLPNIITSLLRTVNAIEMPTRHTFDEALNRFIGTLSHELRETAAFTLEIYADISQAVIEGRVSQLRDRLQVWTTCHHARVGSTKQYLILLPREDFYNMNPMEEERLRAQYAARVDAEGGESIDVVPPPEGTKGFLEPGVVFERVPVQAQIYDVLVYTHRNHGSSATMLFEARRIGMATITWPMVEMFVRLCPLCKLRSKNASSRPMPSDEASMSISINPRTHNPIR